MDPVQSILLLQKVLVVSHMEPVHDRYKGATPSGARGLGRPLTHAVCSCKLVGRKSRDGGSRCTSIAKAGPMGRRKAVELRETTHWWMIEHNEERPHDSVEDLAPQELMDERAGNSIFRLST